MSDVPSQAIQVINTFLDASQRNDLAGMTQCLSRQSLQSGQPHGAPEGVRFVVGESHMEGAQAVIIIRGFPQDAPADAKPVVEMQCLLVQEEGQWKFDLNATMERMIGPQLESAIQQVAGGMAQAMEKVGEALSSALGGEAELSKNKSPDGQTR